MDVINKLDYLLCKDIKISSCNVNEISDKDDVPERDVNSKFTKEAIKSYKKDFFCKDRDSRISDTKLNRENGEIHECFVISDDDCDDDVDVCGCFKNDNDILCSEIHKSSGDDPIEKFLKDCERLIDDEENLKENLKISENSNSTGGGKNFINIKSNDELNIGDFNRDVYPPVNNFVTNLKENEKNEFYDPDFEMFNLRIKQLWEQIEQVQLQLKEAREISQREAREIQKIFGNGDSNLDCVGDVQLPKNTKMKPGNEVQKEKNISKETKATNTIISASTDARVRAKREQLDKMNTNFKNSANIYKNKLKEVEKLCALDSNKFNYTVSILNNKRYPSSAPKTIDSRYKTVNCQLSKKNSFNSSLPDLTKI